MKFCPTCEAKLKKGPAGLRCPKCEYVESSTANERRGDVAPDNGPAESESSDGLNVLDADTGETLPTINIDCAKCENDVAIWWMLQTRSADEPTTQFYRCTKCQYTWRDYS